MLSTESELRGYESLRNATYCDECGVGSSGNICGLCGHDKSKPKCEHDFVDIENEKVSGVEMCTKCKKVKN